MTTRWGLAPLRITIAIGFVMHGESKLARGPDHFAYILEALGVPMPHVAAWLTILVEIIGGLSLLLGAYVRPAAIVLAGVLATAIVEVHWQYGFLTVRLIDVTASGVRFGPVGYEISLVYLAALAALALGEPTPWSIDRWRRARKAAQRERRHGTLTGPATHRRVQPAHIPAARLRQRGRAVAADLGRLQ